MPLKPTPRRVMRHRPRGFGAVASKLRRRVTLPLLLSIVLLAAIAWVVATAAGGGFGGGRSGNLRGSSGRDDLVWVHADSQPFNDQSVASRATHLIVVAGHSVLISGDVANAGRDDSVWWLYDYQRNRGLPRAIVSHIQAGIQIALKDESSLLVFSGGETRAQTGPETEGGSYFRVADALELWDGRDVYAEDAGDEGDVGGAGAEASEDGKGPRRSTVRARTVTEEYATDSFENLLFSVCRFREVTGSYPEQISMVSFSFKRERFETLHARALRWPPGDFHYVAVDPPASTGFDLEESTEGERNNSLGPFRSDPYGCHSEVLQRKRRERNPYARRAPYELTCPEMKDLLKWCGPEWIPKGNVPWGES